MKKILIALTLFKKDIASLLIASEYHNVIHQHRDWCLIDLLVVDNSPTETNIKYCPSFIKYYYPCPTNLGTRGLILYSSLVSTNYDAVMFLDQDTDVKFISKYLLTLKECSWESVYVPIVRDSQSKSLISPCRRKWWGSFIFDNISPSSAILSGSFIPSYFLIQIKTIPKLYWLDYLDHYLYHNHLGPPIVIPLEISQPLSIKSTNKVSMSRLLNITIADLYFCISTFTYIFPLRLVICILRLLRRLPC